MTLAARIFQRALHEKLAFVPLGTAGAKLGQQSAGPGGAPVGAPMDPAAGGMPPAPPMDPAMGGMPPMDPAAGGMPPAPPMDPAAAGGMPPMDPSMGMPPAGMDPSMGMPPDMGMPPMPEPPPAPSGAGVTTEDADVVDKITKRTMDIVRQTLEMVGKAKKPDGSDATAAAPSTVGPITGQSGFDASALPGPLKMAAALKGLKLK